jgi:threonine aldolase
VPQTTIVQVDVSRTGRDADRWAADLDAAGLRVRPLGTDRLRLVTHRHIEPADIPRALAAFRQCLDAGSR